MQCKQCGAENQEDNKNCEICGSILIDQSETQTKTKGNKSRLAIFSVILSGSAAILIIFAHPTLAFIMALSGTITAITSIKKIRKSKGKLVGKSFAILAVIYGTMHCVVLSYLRIDARPVPNDYTISDIRSALPQFNESFQLLESMADANEHYDLLESMSDANKELSSAPGIGLLRQDINDLHKIYLIFQKRKYNEVSTGLQENAQKIKALWSKAKKGTDLIKKLNTFPEIADLSVPSFDSELHYFKNLRNILFLHRTYICLQSCLGNEDEAMNKLITFNSVIKKISLNSRSTISKLVCFACLDTNIRTANFIINNPNTSKETLELMQNEFIPLEEKHLSLRNQIIWEYLATKNLLRELTSDKKLKYSTLAPLKFNSTLRVVKNQSDLWLAREENRQPAKELSVWPSVYPQLPVRMDSEGNFPCYYFIYNPVGSLSIDFLLPAMENLVVIRTRVEIETDLLQIVLNHRLGKQFSLKARAYSDEYIIDVNNGWILCPGADKKTCTKDDRKLMINSDLWQPDR